MLQARNLASRGTIRHGFFTRRGGVSTGVYESLNGGLGSDDDKEAVGENRARMAEALGVSPDRFVTCYQIHSPQVVVADEPWRRDEAPRADAIVTRTPGLAIGVATADCGPVLFADADAGVVGAAHAGWKGALAGVVEATLDEMEKLGARRSRIAVALGPMIRQANYEVGSDLVERFRAANPANAAFFRPGARPGHSLFDLPGYIAARLAAAGIVDVEDLGFCTYADSDRFYSYRRATHRGETDYGRHINAVALVP
jgi:YfiH family protein